MQEKERFGTRLGMMLAMLGMAVGTGNIWRFPRIAAKNGGGEFIVAWVVFLFLWSIPLILLEFGMGRKTRSGPVRAFMMMMGPKWVWMGAFAAWVTLAITCYYSVVAGWTVRFTIASITGALPDATPGSFWNAFTNSYWPIVTHAFIIGMTVWVVGRGVGAIEKVAKVLMPALLGLVVFLTIRALFLPGASDGLKFMFDVDWARLAGPTVWVEALTQNAWDTGAGWGLVLCYAAYMREREDTALNGIIIPTVNNLISLTAGIMVFCTVFSVVPTLVANLDANPETLAAFPKLASQIAGGAELNADLMQKTIFDAGNEGITFIWMPQLFATIPFGRFFMTLFFLALAFAAFTSMIAMVEVPTRVLIDAGIPRSRAIKIIGGSVFLFGIPSALSMNILANQDWVWGVALMLTGLFFSICAIVYGVDKLRREHLNHEDSNIKIGKWWNVVVGWLIPIQAVVLLVWLLNDARVSDKEDWLKFFHTYNVGSVVYQVTLVIVVLVLINKQIAKYNERAKEAELPEP